MTNYLFHCMNVLAFFFVSLIIFQLLAGGCNVEIAVRTAGISDATYYKWRKTYGGMGKSKLHEFKSLEKENERLKRIVADLELDKLILKESLDYLKPKA